VASFSQLTTESLGKLTVFDIDGDGVTDVVGGRGIIARQVGSGFEIDVVLDAPNTNNGRPGQFGGTSAPDLVYATGTGAEILAYLDSTWLDGMLPVSTVATEGWAFSVGDVDADGFDDLAVLVAGGTEVWLWHGRASGTFEKGIEMQVPALPSLTLVPFSPPTVDLLIGDSSNIRLHEGSGAGDFTESGSIERMGIYLMERAQEGGAGSTVLAWEFDNGFDVFLGVGVTVQEGDEWILAEHGIDAGSVRGAPIAADLDADALLDVAFALSAAVESIEFACRTSATTFTSCGGVEVSHEPEAIALLRGEPQDRVVYSTTDAGAWIAELTVFPCG
jgi:hypothetical protein